MFCCCFRCMKQLQFAKLISGCAGFPAGTAGGAACQDEGVLSLPSERSVRSWTLKSRVSEDTVGGESSPKTDGTLVPCIKKQ